MPMLGTLLLVAFSLAFLILPFYCQQILLKGARSEDVLLEASGRVKTIAIIVATQSSHWCALMASLIFAEAAFREADGTITPERNGLKTFAMLSASGRG